MKREIGSFLELELRCSGEYFKGERDIARLNSARSGIYHACRLLGCSSICLPFYLCSSVKKFILDQGIKVEFYNINECFEPCDLRQKPNQAFLLVNYFGILSRRRMRSIASRFNNVIIDNSAAFYAESLDGCYNVYSPRKFFGVPDGGYVKGLEADRLVAEYGQDFSSDSSLYLLKRIEYGLTSTYEERMKNEERISKSGIRRMSVLSRSLLSNIAYKSIKTKRGKNFQFVHELFKGFNLIDPTIFTDEDCVPMVYPLVIKDGNLPELLKSANIYVGRLWKHVLDEVPASSFESFLSKYMVPLPIDQRYEKEDFLYIYRTIFGKSV